MFAHPTGQNDSMSDRITMRQFHESDGVEDWRVVGEGACAYFRTGSFAAGARPVNTISELAGLDDHHPDIDLRYDGVIVRLITVAPDPEINRIHSTSGCPPTRPRLESKPRSPRAATSSPTSTRPPGGRWPTRRATSPTWRRR